MRQTMIEARRGELEACQAVRGVGLEIGAGVRPTISGESNPGVALKVLDFYSTEELRANVAKNTRDDPQKVAAVDFVARGEDYREVIGGERFDFIIANHVFEHIVDPVAWLVMLGELLRAEGHLLLTIPDKKFGFDRFRDDTTIAHLLSDYFSDVSLAEKARVHTIETVVFYDRSYVNRVATAEEVLSIDTIRSAAHHPGVHCHVFQGETFLQRVLQPLLYTQLIDYSLARFREASPWGEFYVVLRKGWRPFTFDLNAFYESARAAAVGGRAENLG